MLKQILIACSLFLLGASRPQAPTPPAAWVNFTCSGSYAYHAGVTITYPGHSILRVQIDEDGPDPVTGAFAETGYWAAEGDPLYKMPWSMEPGYWYRARLSTPAKILLFDSGWTIWCP